MSAKQSSGAWPVLRLPRTYTALSAPGLALNSNTLTETNNTTITWIHVRMEVDHLWRHGIICTSTQILTRSKSSHRLHQLGPPLQIESSTAHLGWNRIWGTPELPALENHCWDGSTKKTFALATRDTGRYFKSTIHSSDTWFDPIHAWTHPHPLHLCYQVNPLDEQSKQKIRAMAQSDIPIAKRRSLYNQLGRRMKNAHGLKPGLLQKYQAALSSNKERFKMLKEFLIDEDLLISQFSHLEFLSGLHKIIGYRLCPALKVRSWSWSFLRSATSPMFKSSALSWHVPCRLCKCQKTYGILPRESVKKNDDIYEKVAFFELEERYGKTEGGKFLGYEKINQN